ncbi:MAG: trypsin-like serine protease [Acidobacteria bacterium]|nr:trypsin-like serine protease [Acidobacteriota bacterium]
MYEQIFDRLIEGEPVLENEASNFQSCVAIINDGRIKGTGVLIAPNIVMTAYHVVTAISGNTVKVSNGLKAFSSSSFTGKRIPEKIITEDRPHRPVGLGFILLDISLPFAIERASEKEVAQQHEGQIVGYGRNTNGDYGVKSKTDVLIKSDNQGDLLTKAFIASGQKDGINPTDSGAPLYIKLPNEILKLAGIANNHMGFGRLGRFIDVTEPNIEKQINDIITSYPAN